MDTNLLILEFKIQLYKDLSPYKVKPRNALEIYKIFNSRFKDQKKRLAFDMNITDRGNKYITWDLLLNKKVLIQLLYFPDHPLKYIKNFYDFLEYPYGIEPLILWEPKKSSLIAFFTVIKSKFQRFFPFLFSFSYYNRIKNIYIYIQLNTISIDLFIIYIYNIYSSILRSLMSLKRKFYKLYNIYITFDNIFTEEILIQPELKEQELTSNSFINSIWKVEKKLLTYIDHVMFCSNILDLLVDNINNISFISINVYVSIDDSIDREFTLSRFSFDKNRIMTINTIKIYIAKILKALFQINIEDNYWNSYTCYYRINIRSKIELKLSAFSTIKFKFFGWVKPDEDEEDNNNDLYPT